MDGTAIMQGCATFFLASLYGIDLGINEIVTIVITATIASIGTAGIPSAGIIMLTVIFTQIGIPLEGITLLLGVDRLLDMMRTSVNVSGDICISCVIASSERKINEKFSTLELYEIDLCLCFKSCAPKSSINFIALQKLSLQKL